MTLACIQCSLKALAEGRKPETFDETAEEHMKRMHPDPVATHKEREELLTKIAEKHDGSKS